MIMNSLGARALHTDPTPWLDTLTGERFSSAGGLDVTRDYSPREEFIPLQSTPTNPILWWSRETWGDEDRWGTVMMILGAIQDVEGIVASGPASDVTTEDYYAHMILEALGWTVTEVPGDAGPYDWPTATPGPEAVAEPLEYLRHAWTVYSRLEDIYRANGESY